VTSATAEAASLSASVNARLAGRLTAWPDDAFKDCGLAQVVSVLGVAPAALDFVVGVDARRVFDISGGVKPYFVEIDGVVVDGVALKSPIRFDARGELSVSSKVAKPAAFKLRISDSSPTALIVELPVSIKAAGESNGKATNGRKAIAPPGPAASSAGGQPSAGAAGTGIDAAVTALKAKGSFKHGGKLFQLPSGPRKKDAKTIELALLCPAGDSATFKRADLERSLLAEIGITQAPPKRPWQIEFTPSGANCLAD